MIEDSEIDCQGTGENARGGGHELHGSASGRHSRLRERVRLSARTVFPIEDSYIHDMYPERGGPPTLRSSPRPSGMT